MKRYRFVNKSIVPRPFKGRILRFNKPVTIDCTLNAKDIESLKRSNIIIEELPMPEKAKKAQSSKPKKDKAKKVKGNKDEKDTNVETESKEGIKSPGEKPDDN